MGSRLNPGTETGLTGNSVDATAFEAMMEVSSLSSCLRMLNSEGLNVVVDVVRLLDILRLIAAKSSFLKPSVRSVFSNKLGIASFAGSLFAAFEKEDLTSVSSSSSSSAAKKETPDVVLVVESVVVVVAAVVVTGVGVGVVVVVDLAVEEEAADVLFDVGKEVNNTRSVVSSLNLLTLVALDVDDSPSATGVTDEVVVGVVVEVLVELIEEFLNRFLLIKRTSFLTASEVVDEEDDEEGFFEPRAAEAEEDSTFRGVGVVLLALNRP